MALPGFILSMMVSLWLSADAGVGKPAAAACRTWLAQTVVRVEKLPEQKWRDTIVSAVADSCDALPEALRKAARDVQTIKQGARRDRLLADAAAGVLGSRCSVADPASDAVALATACPMPARPELQLAGAVLKDVRAVDYAVMNALASKLLAAQQYDAYAERLMMDFALSAGLRGEQARKSKQKPGPSRRR